jgi:acyl carrier protein
MGVSAKEIYKKARAMGEDKTEVNTGGDIDHKLREIFREVFGVDQITDETSPDSVPHWDSLRHIELIMTIERVTGKKFSPMVAIEMRSVREILRVLRSM